MNTLPNDVFAAILEAKKEFKPLRKSGKNPHFKNEYSTLDDIRESTFDSLNKHEVVVVHSASVLAEYTILTTTLRHVPSGTTVEASFFIDNDAPQKMGSAMTYGRRYNLVNLLDLIADVDDDAESYYDRSNSAATTTTPRKGLGGKVR